jgi:opacity protein-like surface antigen
VAEPRPGKIIVAKSKTDRRGAVLLRFNDSTLQLDDIVDVEIRTADGRTRHWYGVEIGTLLANGQIDFQTGQSNSQPLVGEMPPFSPNVPFGAGAIPMMPQSGAYFGFNIGTVVPHASTSWQPNPAGFGGDTGPLGSFSRNHFDAPGFAFGGQVGFDFMPTGNFFVGVVADANLKTNDQVRSAIYASPFGGAFPTQESFRSNFETTERLRVGLIVPVSPTLMLMPYVTGGLAVAQIDTSDSMTFPASMNFGSQSQLKPGWTAGAGVGFITASPLRFQVQWLHEDFGSVSYLATNNAAAASFIEANHRLKEERVTLGVNMPLEAVGAYFRPR